VDLRRVGDVFDHPLVHIVALAWIAEVLLGCLKPHEFMAGKVLGGLAVSLTGAAVYVSGGVVMLNVAGLGAFVPLHIIPWFFTFLVLEIVMVGSYLAALGSACNDPKDAQNMTFPAMIPVFLPMFLAMPILQEPTSTFATVMSLFPLFTPMLMLLRKAAPVGIPAWQPWVGLVVKGQPSRSGRGDGSSASPS
jgi:ABC-2 type transport system permease protein